MTEVKLWHVVVAGLVSLIIGGLVAYFWSKSESDKSMTKIIAEHQTVIEQEKKSCATEQENALNALRLAELTERERALDALRASEEEARTTAVSVAIQGERQRLQNCQVEFDRCKNLP
jgi:arginyl-tRNA synthetase